MLKHFMSYVPGEIEFPRFRTGTQFLRYFAKYLEIEDFRILFPALEEQCWYLICYCLLLYGFFLWEKILDRYSGLRTWGWLLFGLFALRGVDRMIEVMSVYHI